MNNKGFTLVELLVTIGIVAVISIISSEFLLNLLSTSVNVQNKNEVEQAYTFVGTKLVKMIEEAEEVVIDNSNQLKITLNGNVYLVFVDTTNQKILIYNDPLVSNSNVKVSSISDTIPVFSYQNDINPTQIKINLKFEVPSDYGSRQDLVRIATVRKSYKN